MKTLKTLLENMHFDGQVSVRKWDSVYGLTYLGGGNPSYCSKRYGYYIVVGTCIMDNVLIVYVN